MSERDLNLSWKISEIKKNIDMKWVEKNTQNTSQQQVQFCWKWRVSHKEFEFPFSKLKSV